jgi:hypothetical protein
MPELRHAIEVKLRFAGMHHWPGAFERVDYLASPHRHEFHVVARKAVTHDDRDVEFICLKEDMEAWLFETFSEGSGPLNLGACSCERLAEMLMLRFDLASCWVYEDGENGGGVERC